MRKSIRLELPNWIKLIFLNNNLKSKSYAETNKLLNEFLLKKEKEFEITYADDLKNEYKIKITKKNCFDIFYEPIWNNLTPVQKGIGTIWAFGLANKKLNNHKINLVFVTDKNLKDEKIESYCNNIEVFLNLDFPPVNILGNIFHELTHFKQFESTLTDDENMVFKLYDFSKYYTSVTDFFTDENLNNALHFFNPCEIEAYKNQIKYIKKYSSIFNKKFGSSKESEEMINKILENFKYTKKYYSKLLNNNAKRLEQFNVLYLSYKSNKELKEQEKKDLIIKLFATTELKTKKELEKQFQKNKLDLQKINETIVQLKQIGQKILKNEKLTPQEDDFEYENVSFLEEDKIAFIIE